MHYFEKIRQLLLLLACLAGSVAAAQTASPPATSNTAAVAASAGTSAAASTDTIPELHVGQDVYYDVRVMDVTPSTIVFAHRHGIASVALADLSPDLQKRFNYDPAKAAAETVRQHGAASKPAAASKAPPKLDAQQILQTLGKPPKIFAEVNMQPHFDQLGVDAKDKGPRPSSAVFAVVTALEYQCAPADGPAPEFSEEYLIWATLKTLGKTALAVPKEHPLTLDLGFELKQVAEALRTYGIALAAEVPYQFNPADAQVFEPPPDVVDQAKKRSPADGYYITDDKPQAKIANIVQVLDAGVPVIIEVNWPEQKSFADNVSLDAQPGLETTPHTVLLVSYRAKSAKLEDVEFLFKNSYGGQWGERGYGLVTYGYLVNNLRDALFLVPR